MKLNKENCARKARQERREKGGRRSELKIEAVQSACKEKRSTRDENRSYISTAGWTKTFGTFGSI